MDDGLLLKLGISEISFQYLIGKMHLGLAQATYLALTLNIKLSPKSQIARSN